MGGVKAADCIRVLVVDDELGVRDALARVLTPDRGLDVVGSLATADQLVTMTVQLQPDIILLDIDMPGRNSLEAVEDLRYRGHPARVLALSGTMEDWAVRGAVAFGAMGYILKDDAPEAVYEGIAAAMAGRRYFSPSVAQFYPGLLV